MNSNQLRDKFLEYFESHGHTKVASSPLVPANDPTLLFTNAGMVQFKETFLGQEKRNYSRAASSQRCVRAGGKHNDLENVGYTARHHTFFEMLGNFSFGDYFKREAISYAWDFLTNTLNLPAEKLWVTVYEDDKEAEKIWLEEMKIDSTRFSRCGEKDNFWSMGDTGPCGPCSEIFYDHGDSIAGGPPGSPDEDGDRYIEIWNLVFMQYDRDDTGKLTPLPRPSVDTGMGLERLAAVIQNVHNNYDIDLFQNLIKAILEVTNTTDPANNSVRVIADHIRSCTFLIVDSIVPSNEGRGYVLRRIIRRAIRHGYQLGQTQPFFHKLVDALEQEMGQAYPELTKAKEQVAQVLLREEQRFAETLENGMQHLEEGLKNLDGTTIPGELLFRLYDTYGFPLDLTADIARERNLTIDEAGFEQEMEQQRDRARAASNFKGADSITLNFTGESEFSGYTELKSENSKVVDLVEDNDQLIVVLDKTPFYAESGGQAGDSGYIHIRETAIKVLDCKKSGATFYHICNGSKKDLQIGDSIQAEVNQQQRTATATHHSATHLLHAALRKVLGEHVQQKGSLVEDARLRFDFSHFEPITQEQLTEIELLVNQQVLTNKTVATTVTNYDQAVEMGAMALFGEKYGDEVRMVAMGEFSTELCGGTHVEATGEIGIIKITAESGIASGVRRVEAVAGKAALLYINQQQQQLQQIQELLNSNQVVTKVEQLINQNRQAEKELAQLQEKLAATKGDELINQVEEIANTKCLLTTLDGADSKSLRTSMDRLKDQLQSGVILLATIEGNKVLLVTGVTKDLTNKVKAGELIQQVTKLIDGKGGGRPDMAQGGGNSPEKLPAAIQAAKEWLEGKLCHGGTL